MTTAIFLGAGASAAEGAPIQRDLFKVYFRSKNAKKFPQIFDELSKFFLAIFNIDLHKPIEKITFPTFEEALGILDLAEMRRESFRGFDFGGGAAQANQTQLLRLYLILVMSRAIADGLNMSANKGSHLGLVNNLRKQNLINITVFVSTNYDLVIDDALGWQINYGVDFAGPQKFGGSGLVPGAAALYKLHGSLNWLYCPVCNNLNSYESKAVLSLMTENKPINRCGICNSIMSPVIVPPTFYKDMSRVFLSSIWNKTENALRDVDQIIFCGYSLPDADMHIKYLLKRMQTNRDAKHRVRLTIFNHHKGKTKAEGDSEEERYIRFFGKDKVNYTRKSFQEFAKDPKKYYAK